MVNVVIKGLQAAKYNLFKREEENLLRRCSQGDTVIYGIEGRMARRIRFVECELVKKVKRASLCRIFWWLCSTPQCWNDGHRVLVLNFGHDKPSSYTSDHHTMDAAASKWAREPSSDEEEERHRQLKRKREKRFKKSTDSPAFRESSGTPTPTTAPSAPRQPDVEDDALSHHDYPEEPEKDGYQSHGSSEPVQTPPYQIEVPDVPQHPVLMGCRSVENYEKLNRLAEGSYGVVYRARDRGTGEIVALKKLKLDQERNGFPITSLREVYTLLLAKHPHIVNVREIVVGDTLTQ